MLLRQLLAASLYFSALHHAAATPDDNVKRDCFWQLTEGHGATIKCDVPLSMSEGDRAELKRLTRGLLKGAACQLRVSIARRLIDRAITEPDNRFEIPEQPVACEIETKAGSTAITFTFAPEIKFEAGVAVSATPGMGNIDGVPRVLSWPVKTWVNTSDEIEHGMLKVINAYKKKYGPGAPPD